MAFEDAILLTQGLFETLSRMIPLELARIEPTLEEPSSLEAFV